MTDNADNTTILSAAARLDAHPMIEAIGNGKARMYRAPSFLTQGGCDALMHLIDADRRPSTVADSNGDAKFRTSQTCDMKPHEAVVQMVRRSICGVLGIDERFAEPLQGQYYGPGGEFRDHSDYFRPGSDAYTEYCTKAGQRTWTVMGYLNNPLEGGHTNFRHLGVDMTPVAGTLLMWSNLHDDGRVNPMTSHHATPVVRGEKYVITQWSRERPWG